MYGTGMRIMECLSLRVQDIDFERNEILFVTEKRQDRHTMLLTLLSRLFATSFPYKSPACGISPRIRRSSTPGSLEKYANASKS